jgi:gliding motility-associated-like protein
MKTLFSTLLFTLCITAQAQITSTFDSDADGWTFLNSTVTLNPNHSTSGGNPAGFISATYSSNISLSTQNWIAPAKFLGSQILRSMDMNLRFDLQQSQAGTSSNVNGDVRIESGSTIIVYSLPTKPAVAPLWSSYSLKLDETQGWRVGSTTGPFATRTQIIAILSNITAIEIRGTYASNAAYTSGIDNVILEQRTLSPSPTIASFAPTSGEPGTVLTITGTNFDTTPTSNEVYFGSIAGTITSASATQLSVTIPIGASHGPITVINKTTGTSKRSEKPFNPTFTEGGRIIPASFKPRFDILLGTTPGNDLNGLVTADLDGDGWNDLLVTESLPATVSIFRNLGSGGNLSAASFAPKILLASSGAGNGLFTFDLDGDGKLDVVSTNASSFTTYRNTSTPGNLSFEPVELWPNPIVGITSDVVDVDGDGRLDLIGQHYNGSVAGDFWIALNISSPGNIEFGASITYFGGSLLDAGSGVTSGDLDNDGKPDLIVRHWFGGNFSIIKNNSMPGNISLDTPIRFTIGSYGNINIADFNGDGKNDIAWKDGSGNNDIRIRINTNSGGALAATDFATEVILDSELTNYGGMSVADVNGDGKPDIIAADAADVGVFENNYSGGAFDANAFVSAYQLQGYSAATYPFSPVVADLNGDKKPELILGYTNSSPIRISIFENNNVPAPVISFNTVSPLAAPVGATVTITGNNFSTVPVDNHVYFGAVEATVLTATSNQLTASVPAGAAYAPVSVRVGELTSRYRLPFVTTFSSGVTFNNTQFAPPVNFTLTAANYDIEVGDLNRDGKPDILAEGNGGFAFRNTHAAGAISISSLIADDTLSAGSFLNPRLEDFDGDGFLDAVSVNGLAHRNISTPTEISFQPSIGTGLGASTMDQADFNNDGKIDFTVTTDLSGLGDLVIKENRSIVGSFTTGTFGSFSSNIVFNKPAANGGVVTEDFDGDGFADIATTNFATDNISIYRNAGLLKIANTQFASRTDFAAGDSPGRIYKGDFDADGKTDLMLYHGGTSATLIIVFQNTSTVGNLSFNRIDLTNPSATTVATIADLDGDGKPEILTTSESGNRFSIFKNIHTSGALTAASFAAPFNTTVTAPRGITTGDLNLDGKPEIILTRAAGLLVVYENLVSATQNFITQWNLATAGTGATQLTFGTATSGTVNYAWQEISPGTATGGGSWSGTTLTITGLPANAIIRLQIAPTNFQRIIINNGLDRGRLTQVEQWGTTAWISMQAAFRGCANLQVTATDLPNLSGVTNMSEMFRECTVLNSPGNIGSWNTSVVTNMSFMFSQASAFNQNIGAWNTGAVANMSYLFFQATSFNQNIGAWNTAAVTNMLSLFDGASVFNQDIGSWNTGAVTTMQEMFDVAISFNQNIGAWNTASVTDMRYVFSGANTFNQNIGSWSTSAVTNMQGMFLGAGAFNQNIGSWNTGAVTNMSDMFRFAIAFNQNIGGWTLNSGANLSTMFSNSGMDCNNYSATLMGWSANSSTPNGRTLGATGRQYGTNAVAARTNLATTKGWTITGDTPSGTVCGSVSVPTITNFTPASGPIGTSVIITGTNFSTTPANNTVLFNGTTAVVTASTTTSITTTVPVGATTGLISVTLSGNTAVSATTFTVTASPIITITTQPSDFIACVGQTATFTTAATGTTNIIYQWQFSPDGIVPYTDVANGGGYSNATTATLSVNTTANFGLGRYRCRINGDFAAEVITNNEGLFINPVSAAPTVVGANRCGVGSVTLTASGGSNGQYKWYTTATGGTPIVGETNGSYVTPSITSTTSYYVSLNTNGCESTRTIVTATLTITPAPTATGASGCPASAVTLTASGGTSGQYNWYTVATGGSAITGATNNTYQISSLTVTSTFYVSLTISGCESTRTPVTATLLSTGCAPVITTQALTTQVEGKIEINLQSLITTPGTLDPTSIKVITQPASGAVASITNFLLVIDYKGKPFSGKETIIIEACNTNGLCSQQTFFIEVAGEVIVFNAVSPNSDGKNEFLVLQYIESISPNNQVSIYNRWGDEVFSISDYDNKTRVFAGLGTSGSKLPSGTYFYKITLIDTSKTLTGFFSLKY